MKKNLPENHSGMLFYFILTIAYSGSKIHLESFICNPSRHIFFNKYPLILPQTSSNNKIILYLTCAGIINYSSVNLIYCL